MSPSDGKLGGWPRLIRFGAVRRDDAPRDTGPVTRRKISTQDRRITRSLYLDLWGRTPIEEYVFSIEDVLSNDTVDFFLYSPA